MHNTPKRSRAGGSRGYVTPPRTGGGRGYVTPPRTGTNGKNKNRIAQHPSSPLAFSPSRRGAKNKIYAKPQLEFEEEIVDHDEKKQNATNADGSMNNVAGLFKHSTPNRNIFITNRLPKVAIIFLVSLFVLFNLDLSYRSTSQMFDEDTDDLPQQPQQSASFNPSTSSLRKKYSPQRMFYLPPDLKSYTIGETFNAKQRRQIELYPTEYSDITQTFQDADSADPEVEKEMKFHPYPKHAKDENCVPTAPEWQTTFHPSCNTFHEIGLTEMLYEDRASVLSEAGSWRIVWKLTGGKQGDNSTNTTVGIMKGEESEGTGFDLTEKPMVLKTLHYSHDLHDEYYEFQRVDAVATDMLTSSKHVLNIYGFCGLSALNQFAGKYDGRTLTELADSKKKFVDKLRIAKDIAQGLADIHGIDGGGVGNATLIHNDINTDNLLLSEDGVPVFNDFNIAILPMKSKITNKPCSPYTIFYSPQWKSPEEIRSYDGLSHKPLTEKIDIYAFGNILFRFLTKTRAWRTGKGWTTKDNLEVLTKMKYNGTMPPVPESITNSTDPATKMLLKATQDCYQFDPAKRPSASYLVHFFDVGIEAIDKYERLKEKRRKIRREKQKKAEEAKRKEREKAEEKKKQT